MTDWILLLFYLKIRFFLKQISEQNVCSTECYSCKQINLRHLPIEIYCRETVVSVFISINNQVLEVIVRYSE